MKHKVNVDNVDEKYKPLVKEEMTSQELSILGQVILKDKISNFKSRFKWKRKKNLKKD